MRHGAKVWRARSTHPRGIDVGNGAVRGKNPTFWNDYDMRRDSMEEFAKAGLHLQNKSGGHGAHLTCDGTRRWCLWWHLL